MNESTPAVVAWAVQSEGCVVFVFANSERAAACLASEELGIAMGSLQATRVPDMDTEAPGPVSAKALLYTYGQAVACHYCNTPIFTTPKYLERAVTVGTFAFCCNECYEKSERIARRLEPSLKRARDSIRSLCPDAKLTRWWLGGKDGEIVYQFFIPGTHHVATWRESRPNNLFCVADDLEQIEEYRTQSRRLH